MKLNTPFQDEVCEFTNIKKTPLTSLELRITKQFGEIINKFKILYHGWEMDGYGYIVQEGGKRQIVTTNHNQPMIVSADFLISKIKEYEESVKETKKIIEIFKNGKN
jgi:hypothetical protein